MSSSNQNALKSLDLANRISDFLDQSKAVNIVSIDLLNKSSIADSMVIASGTSGRHLKALAEKLKEFLHKSGVQEVKTEGLATCDWVLIDGGDVIVHLFRPEIREFYNLEKMWQVDFSDTPKTQNQG